MNRSTVLALLVGLLVIQGSVAGVVTNDANASTDTTSASTGEPAPTTDTHPTGDDSLDIDATTNASTNDSSASGSSTTTTTRNASGDDASDTTTAATATTATEASSTVASTATTTRASTAPSEPSDGERAASENTPTGGTQAGSASRGGQAGGARAGNGAEAGSNGGSGAGAGGSGGEAGAAGAGGGDAGAGGGAQAASPDAEFNVTAVDSDVSIGETGTVSLTIENTGEDATDAVVNLQSLSGDLAFGGATTTSRFVGEWEEGETRTVEVGVQAAPTADTAEYPIRATVSYRDDDGNPAQSAPLTFGVAPVDEQSFSLGNVDGDLQVGESGTVSGVITNEGPNAATDAVLTVSPNATPDVLPRQTRVVLGDLDPGQSAAFELPVIVDSGAEPGPRQLPLTVQYYDSDGNPMRSGTLNARVEIGEEREDFEIESVDSDVEAGDQGRLAVTINNTGGNVTDARVSLQSLSGGILFGRSANATAFVEEWNATETRTFEYEVTAAESAAETTYPLQASLTYDDAGDPARSGPLAFGVTPGESVDEFRVVATNSDVQIGDEGAISVTLENTGADASAATVSLRSLTPDITFGRTANATRFVGDWPRGAQRTVTFNATASNTTDVRSYPFRAAVSYDDPDGDPARGGPFTIGVTPRPEQAFDVASADSTLRVGDEGNVTATIVNEGPRDVRNAVVQLVARGENLEPQTTDVAIGTLRTGEAANVSFPVEVTDGATAGQRQFSFVVEYDNSNGDPRRSGTLDARVDIAPGRDEFTVESRNATVDSGASTTVTLDVTNDRDSAVRNINAKAFVDAPLSLASDEAYIARLGPGETKRIAFEVSASGDSEGQYPLSVDFQYDTADGDSALSETYDVPIEVTAADDGGLLSSLSVMGGLAALLVVLGVGWGWSRR